MSEVLDRIRGALVGLRMPRALEALDHTMQHLEQGNLSGIEALDVLLSEEYTPEQKAHAGAVVYVTNDGRLYIEGGLIRKDDVKAAQEAGILRVSSHTKTDTPKPVISVKLADDLACIARGARQNAMLDHSDLLLDLLAFHLSGRMGYRGAFGLRKDDVPNWPTSEDAGYVLDERLTTPAPAPKNPWSDTHAKDFKAFRKQGTEKVRAELTRHLASLLTIESEDLTQTVDKETKVNLRDVFTPTAANFFSRVNGAYLDSLHSKLLGIKPDHPSATAFAKLKKAEKAATSEALFDKDSDQRKAAKLSKAQAARIDSWLPEGME